MVKDFIKERIKDVHSITKARERKALDFKSKLASYEGSIMSIATKEVVTIPPTMTIKGAAETMTKYRFRRLPVCDPGTNRLVGIVGSSDIIDFLGGGEKYLLIEKKFGGNFFAAINDSVREIMVTDVLTARTDETIEEALDKLLKTRAGGIVIVDDEQRAKGIITERDFVFLLSEKVTGKKVGEHMTTNVVTATPGMPLGDACKIMVRNSFRRLPVVSQGFLRGLITTRMIIEFIGRNHIFDKIVQNKVKEILDTRVSEIMSRDVPTISKEADIGEAAKIMESSGRGTICVVEDSRLLGILTERDILKALAE
jgi:CBS domain-containing protein